MTDEERARLRAGSKGVQITCTVCGRAAWRRKSEAAAKFCSYSCAAKHNRPPWTPGAGPKAATAALRATEESRFWSKVAQSGPDNCWEWTGTRKEHGYGTTSWRGHKTLAHRVALSLSDGQWANNLCVCHTCDNPPCCNPAHLWRGTARDNAIDRDKKGRIGPRQHGADKPNARVTEAIVVAIRNSALPGSKLAAMYSIGKTTVLQIKRRNTWRHVP